IAIRNYADFIFSSRLTPKNLCYYGIDDELQIPAYLRGLNAGDHQIYYGIEDFHVLVRVVDEVKFLVAYPDCAASTAIK
ncbi:MAG: hypothetical protein IPP22_03450, partial [Nitrosomonas sp.]|nr:hypothetical protein [Nitrosomonas sp.]